MLAESDTGMSLTEDRRNFSAAIERQVQLITFEFPFGDGQIRKQCPDRHKPVILKWHKRPARQSVI